MHLRVIASGLMLFAACATVPGQTCPLEVRPGEGTNGVNQAVYNAVVWDSDGDGPQPPWLVVAGAFNRAGPVGASRIAAFDGSEWHALGAGVPVSFDVLATHNGRLLCAHSADHPAGTPTDAILQWNGSAWQRPGSTSVSGVVSSLIAFNGDLIATGSLTVPTGATRVARMHGSDWSAVGDAFDGAVNAAVVYRDELYVAGTFTTIGGVPIRGIAKLVGDSWTQVGSGLGGDVTALCVYEGDLIAFSNGGLFGNPFARSARWNGHTWKATLEGFDIYSPHARFLTVDGKLMACLRDLGRSAMRWNGMGWVLLGDEVFSLSSSPRLLTNTLVSFRGSVFAGGTFSPGQGSTESAHFLTVLDHGAWRTLPQGTDGAITLFTQSSQGLIAAGRFTIIEGVRAQFIARRDGGAWHSMTANLRTAPSAVTEFQGQLYLGGSITSTTWNGTRKLVRWTGLQWEPAPNSEAIAGAIGMLVPYRNVLLARSAYVPGAVWAYDGATWSMLGAPFPGAGPIYVVDDELYAVSTVTLPAGFSESTIWRWTGDAWASVGPALPGGVTSAVRWQGKTLFGRSNGDRPITNPPYPIVYWNDNAWRLFVPPFQVLGVQAMQNSNGYLVIVPNIQAINGLSQVGVTRGGLWSTTTFNDIAGSYSLVVGRDGDDTLVAHAGAMSFGSTSSQFYGIRRLADPAGLPVITAQPQAPGGYRCGNTVITLSVQAENVLSYQWATAVSVGGGGTILNNGTLRDGCIVSGATTPTLTLTHPRTAERYILCRMTTICGNITSNFVDLGILWCGCSIADVVGPGETEGDGQLTADDIVAYLGAYFSGDTETADVCSIGGGADRDGSIDVDDLIYFINTFFAGCP